MLIIIKCTPNSRKLELGKVEVSVKIRLTEICDSWVVTKSVDNGYGFCTSNNCDSDNGATVIAAASVDSRVAVGSSRPFVVKKVWIQGALRRQSQKTNWFIKYLSIIIIVNTIPKLELELAD